MIKEIWHKIRYWNSADRIGPDMLSTHWRLYFPTTMRNLCVDKFKFFGDAAEFRPGAYAVGCSKISIGKRVVIRPGTMLHADTREHGAGIVIEDDVLLGSGVHIYVDKHQFDNPEKPVIDQGYHESKEVLLKKGCWIGANCIILPGVTIGETAVIGAGSIVTKNVPARTAAAGNPAKVFREIRK
jgi:acetyltransferase-like isoleucine patch superfamily enzyme